MSETSSRSPDDRLEAVDWNATQCGEDCIEPSSAGFADGPLPWTPLDDTLARTSEPAGRAGSDSLSPAAPGGRLQTKTSSESLLSPRTRFEAKESNAT